MDTSIVKFAIDEKSLFYGCINDFEKGHTATVSTPLNQSQDRKKWHNDILSLINTNARIDNTEIPSRLIDICQKNSKSENIIQDVFIFDNIFVDGKKVDCENQYIMYIKRETSEMIRQLNGKMSQNTHLGRLKLHYPITFKYKDAKYNINNEAILKAILKVNKNYAYIVRGFEYNCKYKTLNIITSLIGPENALLSTVFRVAKGVGKKLRTNIDYLNINVLNRVNEKDFNDDDIEDNKFDKRNKTSRYNGKKGEDFIFDILSRDNNSVYHTSVDYPTSPYDMEYIDENGEKIYVEVKSTQSDKIFFRMSKYEYEFMSKYKNQYVLFMVMNVKDEFPKYKILYYKDIMNLKKEVLNYQFTK